MIEAEGDGTFQRGVELLSQQSTKSHVYPRPDFTSLCQYLKSPAVQRPAFETLSLNSAIPEDDITSNFAVIHNLATGSRTLFGPSSSHIAEFAANKDVPEAMLLFLRGFPSPQWLNVIGNKHGASPDLYQRHLQYKTFTGRGRDLCSSPSLPSSSSRVIQLTVSTICARSGWGSRYEPEDLQEARRQESDAMGKYFLQLRNKAKVADSVVRKCLLLSKQERVLEQTISIDVGQSEKGWRAIVWLDSGKDLSLGIEGPWVPPPTSRPWETYFFPVIIHQTTTGLPCDSLTPTSPLLLTNSDQTTNGNKKPLAEWKAAQNICLLPFQYGAQLDKELARQDALYALSEVFRFAAFSEVQFLNLIHNCIEHELSFVALQDVDRRNAFSLLNLKYIKTQLASHARNLAETVSTLENRHTLDWPRAPSSTAADQAAALLLTDFKYLLQRADDLARECEQGMTTLTNSSILEESRRSTENAMRVQKLTVLATIFIPLSFTCSFWGMNFAELGTGTVHLWAWFATGAPIIMFCFIVYHFDVLLRWYHRTKSKVAR